MPSALSPLPWLSVRLSQTWNTYLHKVLPASLLSRLMSSTKALLTAVKEAAITTQGLPCVTEHDGQRAEKRADSERLGAWNKLAAYKEGK